MKRHLINTSAFTRATKRIIKNIPLLKNELKIVLEILKNDIFDVWLKNYKLKVQLEGSYACSVNYNIRIIFEIVDYENSEAVLLESIVTHDEIY